METTVDDLLEDVDDEASARNAEVFITVLNRLDGSRDDIRRKILSSFPPTCKAMRARRRHNRLKRYLHNLENSREGSMFEERFDPTGCSTYAKVVRYTQDRIAIYEHRINTDPPCKECHSCKSNDCNTRFDRWYLQCSFTRKEPFQVYMETELPQLVTETTRNLKEELFSLI